MKVLLDLNVLLDVVQNRGPHYDDSAKVLSLARLGEIQAVLPVHAFTTLYYILAKAASKAKAEQTVDWLLAHFEVAVADKTILLRARQLPLADFEDAVAAGRPPAAFVTRPNNSKPGSGRPRGGWAGHGTVSGHAAISPHHPAAIQFAFISRDGTVVFMSNQARASLVPRHPSVSNVAAEHQSRTHLGGQAEVNLPDLTAPYVWHRLLPACPRLALPRRR